MQIPLCGRQARVSEQLLHRTEIRASIQQMGGEGVPQSVRMGLVS
jgi:hypothetical protein